MEIKKYLKNLQITYKEFQHAPVFTVAEAKEQDIYKNIKGIHSKNLFIKDKKSENFYLVIMDESKKLDMENLGKILGEKIKFANEDDLKVLGVAAGSVSPFGLINDSEHTVKLIIDNEIWNADFVSFHPNINTETLELSGKDFRKYVQSLKNKYEILEL